ncbi:hypothetical protein ACHHYP_20330 [Achlya hypogyna]|uniref:Kinesin-like protein n=1 Tax=Achlya hypogyna TaxID=1202772 RepID=A0A1V9YQV2_ACHHY|nr:hypothetical protein ACHHYP_20330 [Achlya hypogyna]
MTEDGVKVVVRVRPMSTGERAQGSASAVTLEPTAVSLGPKTFTFDHVVAPSVGQQEVYTASAAPLLDSFFAGYNATIFAYGQTGSGKTFTMGTDFGGTEPGVIPQVMDAVFARAATLLETKMTTTVFKLSYLEILNEEIFDLLGPTTGDGLRVSDDPKKGVVVVGLSEHPVTSVDDVRSLLLRGSKQRATASTNMNDTSSRSHAICTLTMHQHPASDTEPSKLSKFHLVDLAGSERAKKTLAEGDRFKEGVHINKALLVLGKVITCLSEKRKGKAAFAPYREAKLTRLLQDSLGGNSKTVMIACVSPADVNFDETTSTLRYAEQARCIQNTAVVNRDPAESEIVYLRHQVELLKLQLQQQQPMVDLPADVQELQAELRSTKNQLEQLRQAKDQWKALAQSHVNDPEAVSRAVAAEMHNMENIDGVIAEKEVIMNALQSKATTDSIEVRLQTLQAQYASQVAACAHLTPSRQKTKLAVATAAEQEVKRLQRLHAQGLLKITSLEQELASLKQIKAQLQRQLAQEAKDHQKDKREADLKLLQLARRDQKQAAELKKLEQTFEKQTHLLKRKNEQLARVQSTKRPRPAGPRAGPPPRDLVHDALDVALTIRGAQAALQTEFDRRKALATELSEASGPERARLASALDAKNRDIRKLQQRLELVQKQHRGAAKLCVGDIERCHGVIRALYEAAVAATAASDERRSLEAQLVAAETQLVVQASAENAAAVASGVSASRERELQAQVDALKSQLAAKRQKKKAAGSGEVDIDADADGWSPPEADDDAADSDYTDGPPRKKAKVVAADCCACNGKCAKGCACRAHGGECGARCSCSAAKCTNRTAHAEIESGVQDILDEILAAPTVTTPTPVAVVVDKENAVPAKLVMAPASAEFAKKSATKPSGLPVKRRGLHEVSANKKIPTMRRLYDGNTSYATLQSRLQSLSSPPSVP